jgi:excinuclease ABC subunit A
VQGAREHNLRDVSASVPREKLVVVTGPSGSGKSTLAFDVIHAEAQRRYLETLSPYARQYLPQLPRPNVDRVAGLPPSVSLEQRVTRGGANSTVATVTEIAHYLRLIYARAGLLHCPDCRVPIAPRQPGVLADDIRGRVGKKTSVTVLAPVVRARKGHHGPVFARASKEKITHARVDGKLMPITRGMKVERFKEHDIEFVIGDVQAGDANFEVMLRRALLLGDGTARVIAAGEETLLSSKRACPSCGRGFPELDPRFFSFNTKQGACEACEGKGVLVELKGRGKSAREVETPCDDCHGSRLSPLARAVTVNEKPIDELFKQSVSDARQTIMKLEFEGRSAEVARAPMKELLLRIAFLEQVGLGYLGLDRAANTLSGGETQRVRLAAQLGSGLTGILYVLDEPTIGLHPRDTSLLLAALRALVDKGCSVLVVEHDSETIRAADHLIDVGPGGGSRGGHVIAAGKASKVLADPKSVTGTSLAKGPLIPKVRRPVGKGPMLSLKGAREHNLKNVSVDIPLGRLVSVTGVSGSGKSTLVREVLLRAARQALKLETDKPGAFATLKGIENIKRAIEMDQSPIGRTPRSVPATYVGIWDELRRLLAATPEARARGYTASRFSFNVAAGRCPSCEGQGALTVEMSFLPEVLVPCEDCNGMRFNDETRAVKLTGFDAAGLLNLDIEEAAEKLHPFSKVAAPLRLLADLGLGYLKLGQPSNTLSGGEAQRIKLVAELGGASGGPTLYVMDEPTTGLHRDDVRRLIGLLNRLVDRGDTVVVIEHHTDVMLASDWIIDMGPEGGAAGGTVVAAGTPEDIAKVRGSHTGAVLKKELAEAKQLRPNKGDVPLFR